MTDILLITWHGIHDINVTPGLPDTGGQNIYVQNMARTIHDLYNCRVTVLNRGGYPHPYADTVFSLISRPIRVGYDKDPFRDVSVLHVSDGVEAFLRKEYITPALIEKGSENALKLFPGNYSPDLIISHFWDGGLMGLYLNRHFNTTHMWVPHETVGIKKEPLPLTHYDRHSISIREDIENRIIEKVDHIGVTSHIIREDLEKTYAGKYNDKMVPAPPGVDTDRFYPAYRLLPSEDINRIASFLKISPELLKKPHICEFGRSDTLKHKDAAVEVFAGVAELNKDVVLFMNLDMNMEPEMASRVQSIIDEHDLHERVIILSPEQLPQTGEGSEILPALIRTSEVFISMSVMEGFGMAVCEAAASGIPVVGTNLIPVLTDIIEPAGGGTAVNPCDIRGAVEAVMGLLKMDPGKYNSICYKAYKSIIPALTWTNIVEHMINNIGIIGE